MTDAEETAHPVPESDLPAVGLDPGLAAKEICSIEEAFAPRANISLVTDSP